MRTRRYSLGLALLALVILPLSAAQQAIILVRHAEKIADDMNGRDVPLSKAGLDRARLLAEMLRDSGITAIYASDAVRTRSTALPLAKELRLSIKSLDQHDPQGAVRRLRTENANDVVLIVGHSDTLPGLLDALGYRREVRIHSNDYSNLLVVIPRVGKPPAVIRVAFGEGEGPQSARRESPPAPPSKSALPGGP